jgi:hypothetical protein
VQVKEHGDYNWTDLYPWGTDRPTQSESNYTIITYPLREWPIFENLSDGSQVDIQVQALVGDWVYQEVFPPINPSFPFPTEWTFYGTLGNWSGTQTITLVNGAISTSLATSTPSLSTSTPTSSQNFPELPALVIVLLLLSLFIMAIILKNRNNKTKI